MLCYVSCVTLNPSPSAAEAVSAAGMHKQQYVNDDNEGVTRKRDAGPTSAYNYEEGRNEKDGVRGVTLM